MLTLFAVIAAIVAFVGCLFERELVAVLGLVFVIAFIIAIPVKGCIDDYNLMTSLGYEVVSTEQLQNTTPNELKQYPYVAFEYWKKE